MANPTPNQVNAKAAAKADPTTTTTTTEAPEMPQDEPKAGKGGDTPTRYHVDKAFTLADGQVVMPGTEWSPDADFPKRRPQQLVEQKFLRPID